MSLGQMIPPPTPEEHCPFCGEAMPPNAAMCWLCLRKISAEDAPARPSARDRKPTAPRARAESHGDKSSWAIFAVIGVGLCVALAFEAPGLLILALVVLTPLLIRAFLSFASEPRPATSVAQAQEHRFTSEQHQQADSPKPIRRQSAHQNPVGRFVSGVLSLIAVGILAISAFCGAFFVVCTGGLGIASAFGGSENAFMGVCSLALVAGIVAAIYVAVRMFGTIWPK